VSAITAHQSGGEGPVAGAAASRFSVLLHSHSQHLNLNLNLNLIAMLTPPTPPSPPSPFSGRFAFEAFDCYLPLFYLAFYQLDVQLLRLGEGQEWGEEPV